MSHSQEKIPFLKFVQSILTTAAKGEDMFAKLGETKKAEGAMGSNKPKSEMTIS